MKRIRHGEVSRMCTGKRKYKTQGDALDAVAVIGLERYRDAYRCAVCQHWHLTSKGASSRRA